MSWPTTRAEHLVRFERGHSTSEVELNNASEGTRYLRTSDLMYGTPKDPADGRYAAQLPPRPVLKQLDEPVATIEGFVRADSGSTIGVVCWSGEGLLNNHVVRVASKDTSRMDVRFARYAALREENMGLLRAGAQGAISQSSGHVLRTLRIPVPPLREQRRIADFLDEQVSCIEGAANARKAQRTLLTDRWSSLVQEAFDNVDGRPISLKHLAAAPLTNGLGLPGEHADPSWPRYIRTTDIAGPFALRDDVFASQHPAVAQAARVRVNDILMTAAGATIGKSVLITESVDACYAGFLVRFRPATWVEPRYIAYWMQTQDYWGQIERGAVRSTIDNFSASKYRNLTVPIPAGEQMHDLVRILDEEWAVRTRLEYVLGQSVGLLEERKRALITAAVTGELDVTTARTGVLA